ncbi:hypothetical protein ACIQZD_21415 [Peribacillus sp. NPDC096447]|uniref:hypothetical protein n=1 Tax=Peribacillus sp. NPDC096447 TaxID=3364394 RepID=UPI0038174862
MKGKLLVSKSAKQEYDQAISTRENYQDMMKKEGVSGRMDLEKQFHTLGKMEARVPAFKDQILAQAKGLALFGAIMEGIEQAGRNMQLEEQRQNFQRQKPKRRKPQHREFER